jgi:dTDP-glucose 4,6-dehydratase
MSAAPDNPLAAGLDDVLRRTRPVWEELRGQRIFVTGGTGFFGCWLLETFAWANDRCGLGAEMLVLTRNPEAFRLKAPHLAGRRDISFCPGDVRDFPFPGEKFGHVIHAATETVVKPGAEDPALMLETIQVGTRRALEFARHCGAHNFLLTSSGAVYGTHPPEVTHVPEEYPGAPDVSKASVLNAYGEGKRVAELLCAIHASQYGLKTKIARCFAFVGPYLPLDAHFAIGNFIRDALAGGPLSIKGDGSPFRSYLYAADLAGWLWTILLRGTPNRPYNVGSSHAVSILETAQAVARVAGGQMKINIAEKPKPGQLAQHYVPNINRATSELGLDQWTQLEDAIRATMAWHRERGPAQGP